MYSDGEFKRKRGRPCEDSSMRNQYRLMMDDDMKNRLDDMSRISGKTRAEILREAFYSYERNISYDNTVNLGTSKVTENDGYEYFYYDYEDECDEDDRDEWR